MLSLLLAGILFSTFISPVQAKIKFQKLDQKRKRTAFIAKRLLKKYIIFNFLRGKINPNPLDPNDNNPGDETTNWITYESPDHEYQIKYPEQGKIMDYEENNPVCILIKEKNLLITIFASDVPSIFAPENDGFIGVDDEMKSQLENIKINDMTFMGNYYFHYLEDGQNLEGISAYTEHNGKYLVISAHHVYSTGAPLSEEGETQRIEELKNGNLDFMKIYWEMLETLKFQSSENITNIGEKKESLFWEKIYSELPFYRTLNGREFLSAAN